MNKLCIDKMSSMTLMIFDKTCFEYYEVKDVHFKYFYGAIYATLKLNVT